MKKEVIKGEPKTHKKGGGGQKNTKQQFPLKHSSTITRKGEGEGERKKEEQNSTTKFFYVGKRNKQR